MNYSKGEFFDEVELLSVEPIFKEVEKIVLDSLGYDMEMLKTKTNSKGYVYPRMIFSYLCSQRGLGITIIGKRLNKDHSTIAHYLKNYDSYYKYDKIFKIIADAIVKNK